MGTGARVVFARTQHERAPWEAVLQGDVAARDYLKTAPMPQTKDKDRAPGARGREGAQQSRVVYRLLAGALTSQPRHPVDAAAGTAASVHYGRKVYETVCGVSPRGFLVARQCMAPATRSQRTVQPNTNQIILVDSDSGYPAASNTSSNKRTARGQGSN
jgi:hypothetical protein